jgi:hypothetical protein
MLIGGGRTESAWDLGRQMDYWLNENIGFWTG